MKAMSRMPRFHETEGGFCSGIKKDSARGFDHPQRRMPCVSFDAQPKRGGTKAVKRQMIMRLDFYAAR